MRILLVQSISTAKNEGPRFPDFFGTKSRLSSGFFFVLFPNPATSHPSMQTKSPKLHRFRWLKRLFLFFSAWIMIHAAYITLDGMNDFKGNADVAVVLGNRVFADGSLSTWLKGRVDKSLELYKEHRVKKIFVSGGISTKKDGGYPEGDAMRDFLIKNGVPASDIITDNAGINTYYTAKNFIDWNQDQHYSSVVVVSQFFHITRTKYIFKKLGYQHVYSTSSDSYRINDLVGLLREVPAFYKYLLMY